MSTRASSPLVLIVTIIMIMSLTIPVYNDPVLVGYGMIATKHAPNYTHTQRPPGFPDGLEINGVLYRYAVDVMELYSNKTTRAPLNFFGIGCDIYAHLGLNIKAHGGIASPTRTPNCIGRNVTPITLIFNCNPNECNPVYLGTAAKIKNSSTVDAWSSSFRYRNFSWALDMNVKQGERPSTYTTNFEYFLNDFGEAELSIKNGTAVYTGATFYCSEEADCLTSYNLY